MRVYGGVGTEKENRCPVYQYIRYTGLPPHLPSSHPFFPSSTVSYVSRKVVGQLIIHHHSSSFTIQAPKYIRCQSTSVAKVYLYPLQTYLCEDREEGTEEDACHEEGDETTRSLTPALFTQRQRHVRTSNERLRPTLRPTLTRLPRLCIGIGIGIGTALCPIAGFEDGRGEAGLSDTVPTKSLRRRPPSPSPFTFTFTAASSTAVSPSAASAAASAASAAVAGKANACVENEVQGDGTQVLSGGYEHDDMWFGPL